MVLLLGLKLRSTITELWMSMKSNIKNFCICILHNLSSLHENFCFEKMSVTQC